MYWDFKAHGIFKSFKYKDFMTRARFDYILSNLKFSSANDEDDQITDLLDAVNEHLQTAMRPGDFLCLDESVVKAFHKNLKGKIKIIRKPRPIGNVFKTLCDARSKIVLYMELHKLKEIIQKKIMSAKSVQLLRVA